jgi:hypothetical protein
MRTSSSLAVGLLSVLGTLSLATTASAQGPSPATAAPPPAAQPAERAERDGDDDGFKSIAITANPLSLILTRIGLNFEYMVAKHHGLILNPYFQSLSVGADPNKSSYTNFGGELGYRFYTGSRGANGFFVGPFVSFMQSNASATTSVAGKTTTADSSISVYGAGVDLGGQHVFQNGFTIGAGAGVQYLKASATASNESSTFKVEGVLPRLLFTVGYSF